MTYEITYFSPNGHAEALARAFQELLPQDTPVRPLTEAVVPSAQTQLVGIELSFREQEKLPRLETEFLKSLGNKTVFLFVTVPFVPDSVQQSRVHKLVEKALPHECDYRGMFLCPAQPAEELLEGFRHAAQVKPDNARIRHWLSCCERSVGHPDGQDLRSGKEFARHVLKLT